MINLEEKKLNGKSAPLLPKPSKKLERVNDYIFNIYYLLFMEYILLKLKL